VILQRIYADTIVFFGDSLGGDRIGAIWLPTLNQPRSFKVLGGFSSMPMSKVRIQRLRCLDHSHSREQDNEKGKDKDKSLVVLNKDAILAEVKRIGEGMIKNISVQDR
jgi:U3 small nucleolar RNA-associated protein 22